MPAHPASREHGPHPYNELAHELRPALGHSGWAAGIYCRVRTEGTIEDDSHEHSDPASRLTCPP